MCQNKSRAYAGWKKSTPLFKCRVFCDTPPPKKTSSTMIYEFKTFFSTLMGPLNCTTQLEYKEIFFRGHININICNKVVITYINICNKVVAHLCTPYFYWGCGCFQIQTHSISSLFSLGIRTHLPLFKAC